MKKLALLSIPLLAGALFWAFAQPAQPSLSSLFPAGALLYLEAKDFSSLVNDWNGSAEKRAWLASANYEAFSRSRLLLKLGQAQDEFASAAGIPADYALAGAVAGTNSALAMYHIGNLEFLYITHLASARALNTALWKARGTYQTRRAAGIDYYVKEDPASHRIAAFTYTGDTLLLATKEDLIAGALELIARQPRPSVASEKWLTDAVQSAAPGPNDLRLVYNLDRLIATPHFRSYWVQRNNTALREFSGGLADLERARGEFRERRILLRSNPTAAASDESAAAQVLATIPDDAGFYRARLHPSPADAQRWIEDKLFASSAAAGPRSKLAPVPVNSSDAGSEQDLETRIDEAPLTDDRDATAFTALRDRLAVTQIDAMLDVQSTRIAPDQVLIGSQMAIVLLARDPWNPDEIRTALTQAAGSLWSTASLGAGWRAASNGVQELDGLGKLALAIDGRWLILGNSPDLVATILARRNRTAATGAVYAAGWRHARELPNFERLTKLIDFPQIPPPAATPDDANPREPLFFSENLASLGRTLVRIQAAEITVHDAGTMLRESLLYRIAP